MNWLGELADWITGDKRKFVITRTWSNLPYLTRWVLVGERGGEPGGKSSRYGVYLHRFQRSDADEPHDHPWPFVSVILSGGYWEETPAPGWKDGDGPMRRRWYGPGRILVRPANWIHRVVIPDGAEAWTLILRGPKAKSWGFYCPRVGYLPWRVHLANAERTGVGCPGA